MDSEGRPVPGANVRVARVLKVKGGNLTTWIEAIRRGRFWAANNYLIGSPPLDPRDKPPAVSTNAQGRFRLEGFGAEQVLVLTIQGPTIASTARVVITRKTEPIAVAGFWIFGADLVTTASPMQTVEGVVRDVKTRQPLAGVEVRTDWPQRFVWHGWEDIRATTDTQGRFRLVGLPKKWREGLLVVPNAHQPYFTQRVAIADATDFDIRLMTPLDDVSLIPRGGQESDRRGPGKGLPPLPHFRP